MTEITPEWIDELIEGLRALEEQKMAWLRIHTLKLCKAPGVTPPPPVPVMAFSLADVQHAEGDSGTTTFTFSVSRSVVTTGAATVDWAVTGYGVNPANAADFGGAFPSGTVNFADGESVKTFDVLVSGDATVEQDETFLVTLSNPSSGVILDSASTAVGTILNDDTAPPPTNPQPITLPDLHWMTDVSSVTGAATGWADGTYPLIPGVDMIVSGEVYTLEGAPF